MCGHTTFENTKLNTWIPIELWFGRINIRYLRMYGKRLSLMQESAVCMSLKYKIWKRGLYYCLPSCFFIQVLTVAPLQQRRLSWVTFIVRIEVGVIGSDSPQSFKSISCGNSALSEHQVFLNTFVIFLDVQRFLKSGQGFCLDLKSNTCHC